MKLQDAYLGGLMEKAKGKLVAAKEESSYVDLSESETCSFHEEEVTVRPVAYKTATGKPGKAERKRWPHNLHMSLVTVPHTDAVFSIVRKFFERARGPNGGPGRERGYLGRSSEYHSSSSSSSWSRL